MTKAEKRRLLFISRAMPWPLNGGARIRDFGMLSALSQLFEIDLLTVGRSEPRIEPLCRRIILPSPYYGDESSWLALKRWTMAGIETMRGPEPLWLTSKTNGKLRNAIRSLANSGEYDAIHASELSSAAALIGHTTTPVVYDAHNCEWRLLERTQAKQKWPWLRAAFGHELTRVREVEKLTVTGSSLVLVTANSDLEELSALGGSDFAPAVVIPSAIDLDRYTDVRNTDPEPGTILVPGKFDWRPNLIGLEWFAADVVSRLRERMEGRPFRVVVAGRMTEKTARMLNALPNVEAARNPDDMLPYFGRATAVAVPVLVSSGTRLRMAEAMACRRPIVATTPGAAGLIPKSGKPWIVADDEDDFAEALADVLSDSALAGQVAEDGWSQVQDLDWRSLCEPLNEAYDRMLGERK